MEYSHKSSPYSREFKVVASARKVMLTVFWDSGGIVHKEFLKQGNTVNSEQYIFTLRKLSVRRVRPTKQAILHHDNARPHTSHVAELKRHCIKMNFVELPHQSYSPDIAPSDFYLYPKLKEHL
ncbi:histone-lysine N-methyltransferase SETMAR [Elysia marginata]|uniref:Histone-lysine N-methyltransferase SETMAR n=1 Tax=Elysia marginata TaxID=1093978 RepID=A0AAV4I930_9GAST|nr:histone-lysine N-methyltransferase SETMAR [Elysia marginata]